MVADGSDSAAGVRVRFLELRKSEDKSRDKQIGQGKEKFVA